MHAILKAAFSIPLSLASFSAPSLAASFSVERVSFPSQGATLVGDLFLPEGVSSDSPRSAVIVTGAWLTVKEQMPEIYARAMAERGFIALTFDFHGWGESGGTPRAMEAPMVKAADIVAAAEFLATRDDVAVGGIGGLGICASAAYMATAATQTSLIRSVGLVAPGIPTLAMITTNMGGPEGVERMVAIAREAKAVEAATGEGQFVPAASLTDNRAIMFGVPYYTEADRGLIPEWENLFNLGTWEDFVAYDPQSAAAGLTQPLFYVHSEAATLPDGIRQFASAAPNLVGSLWLDGVTQFDFYDQPGPVARSSDAMAAHFNSTL